MHCHGITRTIGLFLVSPPTGLPCSDPTTTRPLGSDINCKTRLDICSLDRSVERYFRSGLAPSTQNCYDSAKRRFLHFCNNTGLSPLPLRENSLCRYILFLADEGLSPKTIKSYLSATRHFQVTMNLPNPKMGEMARLEQLIKGAKREYAKRNHETRVRLPITPDILLKLRSVWSRDAKDFDRIMLWAACCLCFYRFLRSGEITVPSDAGYDSSVHLNMANVSVDNSENPAVVKVKIKASQNRPVQKGGGHLHW